MVARVLTTALLLVVLLLPAGSNAARSRCLNCHPQHYADQGACSDCHRGNPASDRKDVAHHGFISGRYAGFALPGNAVVEQGRKLLDHYACRRCHVIGTKGNRLSLNLDSSSRRRTPDELSLVIRNPSEAMPDFGTSEQQRIALISALLAEARQAPRTDDAPRVVHFSGDVIGTDVFSVKCGSCHRALTQRLGAVGRGTAGPNLSGLLSPFYPKNFRSGQEWNEERLKEWLKNPRRIRPTAVMQPVKLTEKELRDLCEVLRQGARE